MPIQFAELKDAIRHTLGGDPAAGASYARIINGAGRAWVNAHGWYYLANREVTLTATAGSQWVELPDDYQAFVQLVPTGDGYATVAFVSPQDFVWINQATTLGSVSSYTATIVQRVVSGVISPWLRLFPTPSIADEFTLLYDAQWGDVNEDEDNIPVPKFAEAIFEEWVLAYARGLNEEDAASVGMRLDAIKVTSQFRDATRADALTTGAVVKPGVGAASRMVRPSVRWNHPNNLA